LRKYEPSWHSNAKHEASIDPMPCIIIGVVVLEACNPTEANINRKGQRKGPEDMSFSGGIGLMRRK